MPTTISSDTNPPDSIAFFAAIPFGVCAATAALSMSPVAKWHKQCSLLIFGACVPLPHPGGPVSRERSRQSLVMNDDDDDDDFDGITSHKS